MKENFYKVGDTFLLANSQAICTLFDDNSGFNLTINKQVQPIICQPQNDPKKKYEFVQWGAGNKFPMQLIDKIFHNVTVSANLDFNSKITYGDGIMVVKKVRKADGSIDYQEVLDSEQPEIFKFLQENNYKRLIQEAANDFSVFYDGYIELTCNKEKNPKIIRIAHKEACYSRITKMENGKIKYHGYSSKWTEKTCPDDIVVTPLLDNEQPIMDIKNRIATTKERRFMLSLGLPTPGRFYYNKPYWWSIFQSGWYDFACAIPKFKKALIKNQMALKYHVKINSSFFERLFLSEKITEPEQQIKRKKAFFQQLDNFLSGEENAGKGFISYFGYDQLNPSIRKDDVVIDPIKSEIAGGEYISDSEEASNIICYAMGVHPSIIGASPGKNKSINGTEARELFIIKQAIMKPIRDMLLLPLYICKEINKWDRDIHFVIPNIMLTTLDKNTGAVKSIGNQQI